ncbi:DUF2905 domain-containing protein [Bacillus sp. JCM 19034]|uniref:DUF2905 domain-containing protein n=1 Tax=Bacillus sp. JCM 19034 TaxID=1481928 RepID=UPI0007802A31|nr:DUF2905 domain-containing protein [Bacillus sp. JCM 19034]
MNFAKVLIGLGVLFIIIGLLWLVIDRFIPLGKLPGDIMIRRENMTFYFPIMTSIIVSIILSLIFLLFRR